MQPEITPKQKQFLIVPSTIMGCHAGLKLFVGNWTGWALNHYPPSARSGAFFPGITSLIAARDIIQRIIDGD